MARSTKKFSYKKRDYRQALRRTEQSGGSRDNYLKEDTQMFKPAEGNNRIRILPPTWENAEHYGFDVYVHYSVGPDNATYICPNKMKGEPCPICEMRAEAESEGDKDYASKLRAKKRVLVYLLDRDHEKDGPKVWSMPWTVDKDLMLQATDKRTHACLAVDDPDDGYDVDIDRSGTGERTEYAVRIDRTPSELDMDDEFWDIIEQDPIESLLIYYDYDHIKQVADGGIATPSKRDEDEDEDEEKPRARRAGRHNEDEDEEKPRARRAGRHNEDEDEEKPRARRAGRHKPEPEPEPEPEVEEEEHTWESVHELAGEELDELVGGMKLDLDPGNFGSDEELQDAICEELGLRESEEEEEPEKEEEESNTANDRLSRLRNRRRRG